MSRMPRNGEKNSQRPDEQPPMTAIHNVARTPIAEPRMPAATPPSDSVPQFIQRAVAPARTPDKRRRRTR